MWCRENCRENMYGEVYAARADTARRQRPFAFSTYISCASRLTNLATHTTTPPPFYSAYIFLHTIVVQLPPHSTMYIYMYICGYICGQRQQQPRRVIWYYTYTCIHYYIYISIVQRQIAFRGQSEYTGL